MDSQFLAFKCGLSDYEGVVKNVFNVHSAKSFVNLFESLNVERDIPVLINVSTQKEQSLLLALADSSLSFGYQMGQQTKAFRS